MYKYTVDNFDELIELSNINLNVKESNMKRVGADVYANT